MNLNGRRKKHEGENTSRNSRKPVCINLIASTISITATNSKLANSKLKLSTSSLNLNLYAIGVRARRDMG